MSALAEFLLARIAEIETRQNNTFRRRNPAMSLGSPEIMIESGKRPLVKDPKLFDGDDGWHEMTLEQTNAYYARAFDPSPDLFVLAECSSKRQILALHKSGDAWCDYCRDANVEPDWAARCPTLQLLALPFADHPDYREEWVCRGD